MVRDSKSLSLINFFCSLEATLVIIFRMVSTVLTYYNTQVANINNSPELIDKAKQKRKTLINEQDKLIDGMHDSKIE